MREKFAFFRSINALLRVGFLVVFGLIVLSTISSLEISARRTRLRGWVLQSYTMQNQIQRTVSALYRADAVERDTVLRRALGKDALPYSPSLPKIVSELDALLPLTRDTPRQRERLNTLRPLAVSYENRLRNVLSARTVAGSPRRSAFPDPSPVEPLLRILKEMERDEERILQQRLEALNQYAQNSELLLLVVRLVALVGVTAVYAGVSRIAREKEGLVEQLGKTNERLETLAATDFLTGLYNQRAFHRKVEEAFEMALASGESGHLSLIVLDIDHFKQYNDTYGHPAGDDVLETVGRLLKHGVRKTDFAARNGGEEFTILLPHTTAAEATRAAEGIRAMIAEQPWPLRPITASFGVATVRPEMASADALTCAADLALYTSKRNGRNQVCHFDVFDAPDSSLIPEDEE